MAKAINTWPNVVMRRFITTKSLNKRGWNRATIVVRYMAWCRSKNLLKQIAPGNEPRNEKYVNQRNSYMQEIFLQSIFEKQKIHG